MDVVELGVRDPETSLTVTSGPHKRPGEPLQKKKARPAKGAPVEEYVDDSWVFVDPQQNYIAKGPPSTSRAPARTLNLPTCTSACLGQTCMRNNPAQMSK